LVNRLADSLRKTRWIVVSADLKAGGIGSLILDLQNRPVNCGCRFPTGIGPFDVANDSYNFNVLALVFVISKIERTANRILIAKVTINKSLINHSNFLRGGGVAYPYFAALQ